MQDEKAYSQARMTVLDDFNKELLSVFESFNSIYKQNSYFDKSLNVIRPVEIKLGL